MAHDVDGDFMPVGAVKSFEPGIAKVFCWFAWKDAKVGSQVTARWRYVTGDILILDYDLQIPRQEGAGGVALVMPKGKALPAGLYQVTLLSGGKELASQRFEIRKAAVS